MLMLALFRFTQSVEGRRKLPETRGEVQGQLLPLFISSMKFFVFHCLGVPTPKNDQCRRNRRHWRGSCGWLKELGSTSKAKAVFE